MTKVSSNNFETILTRLRNNDPTLTALDLSYKRIGNEGVKALAEALQHNQTLTSLGLRASQIGDEGAKDIAEVLQHNKTITSLDLECNQIGDEGAIALAGVLRTNTSLKKLKLAYNGIGDVGVRALANVLRTNTSLKELNLQNNEIGDEGVIVLADVLRTNTSLTQLCLACNHIRSKAGFQTQATIYPLLERNQEIRRQKLKGFAEGAIDGMFTQVAKSNPNLPTLPTEMLLHIGSFLHLKDVAAVASTCQAAYQTAAFERDKKEIKRAAITQKALPAFFQQTTPKLPPEIAAMVQPQLSPQDLAAVASTCSGVDQAVDEAVTAKRSHPKPSQMIEQEQLFAQGAMVGAFRNAGQQNPSLPDTEQQGEVYSYIATFLDPLSATQLALTCKEAYNTAKHNAQENTATTLGEVLPPLDLPLPPAPTGQQLLLGTQRKTSGEEEATSTQKEGRLEERHLRVKRMKEKQPVSKEDKAYQKQLSSLEKQYSAACEQKPGIARDDALEKVLKKGNELLLCYENDSAKQESLAKLVENAFLAMGTEEKPSLGKWTTAVARSSKRVHTPSNQLGRN